MGSVSKSSSRKSFLIDSLLEERQRQLAAQSEASASSASQDLNSSNDVEMEENEERSDENANEKMPQLLMDAPIALPTLNAVTPKDEDGAEEEEERERNTSTRSPAESPRSPLNTSIITSTPQPIGGTLQALAASVASSPLFSLFSKFMQTTSQASDQKMSEAAVSVSPLTQNHMALAQSIDYYNRLRLLNSSIPVSSPSSTPVSSMPSLNNNIPWSSATQNLLAAAALAAASQEKIGTLNGLHGLGVSGLASNGNGGTAGGAQLSSSSLSSTLHPALHGLLLSHRKSQTGGLPAALAALNASTGKRSEKTLQMNEKQKLKTRVGRSGEATRGRASTGATRSSNVKKYRCDVCEKTFSRSNTLITHKRIHTGEKPFRCEHCNRAFRQPGNLTRHRLTHTTVKPFVCTECDKAFNRASNLHTHMRTHTHYPSTAWTPILCAQCGRSFTHKHELKAHVCESLNNTSMIA